MRRNEDNRKALPGDSKAQATAIVRALSENFLFLLLSVSSPLFICCSFFSFFFCLFPCFFSPCDEEQRTVMASRSEFGSGFFLCVWLAFLLWFSVCTSLVFCPIPLFPVFFLLFFSCFQSPVFSCFQSPSVFWVFSYGFSSNLPLFLRPFSGFYKAREGLVSLPLEMVGIVEVRDHGCIVGVVAMICWIFPC